MKGNDRNPSVVASKFIQYHMQLTLENSEEVSWFISLNNSDLHSLATELIVKADSVNG